jgi:hypothetical protein
MYISSYNVLLSPRPVLLTVLAKNHTATKLKTSGQTVSIFLIASFVVLDGHTDVSRPWKAVAELYLPLGQYASYPHVR